MISKLSFLSVSLFTLCLVALPLGGCDGIFADLDDIEAAVDAGDDDADSSDFKTCEELSCERNQECVEPENDDAYCDCLNGFHPDPDTGECVAVECPDNMSPNGCGSCTDGYDHKDDDCLLCDEFGGKFACDDSGELVCELEANPEEIDFCCIDDETYEAGYQFRIVDGICDICDPEQNLYGWTEVPEEQCSAGLPAYAPCQEGDQCDDDLVCYSWSPAYRHGRICTVIGCDPEEGADECPPAPEGFEDPECFDPVDHESRCLLPCDEEDAYDCPEDLECLPIAGFEVPTSTRYCGPP